MGYSGKYSSQGRKQEKTQWRIFPLLMLPVFLAVIIFSTVQLLRPGMEQDDLKELAQIVQDNKKPQIILPEPSAGEENKTEIGAGETMTPAETGIQMLPQYAPIYERNPDTFGWIHIEGTELDYPVMHAPEDPQRYLHKDFAGEESISGIPFLSEACYEGCGNYILYGHNMANGSMFREVMAYCQRTHWQEHPVIQFDTLYEEGQYEVFAAFYSEAYLTSATGVFRVYDYPDLTEEETFQSFVSQAKRASLYDTGITPEYGTQLLTLITCSYHTEDGRFVVIAAKK